MTSTTSTPKQQPFRWVICLSAIGLALLVLGPSLLRLALNVWLGAIATGLGFALVALGVYLTFRVLNFPDLTIDGSLPLGAGLTATLITAGVNPYWTLPVSFLGGALAGIATALITTRLRIHSLLASILVTTGLLSINLRVMGRSNIPLLNVDTIFTPFATPFRTALVAVGGEGMARLGLAVALLALMFGQTALGFSGRTVATVAALHIPNGVLIAMVASALLALASRPHVVLGR